MPGFSSSPWITHPKTYNGVEFFSGSQEFGTGWKLKAAGYINAMNICTFNLTLDQRIKTTFIKGLL
jgi:hypothetical protein